MINAGKTKAEWWPRCCACRCIPPGDRGCCSKFVECAKPATRSEQWVFGTMLFNWRKEQSIIRQYETVVKSA